MGYGEVLTMMVARWDGRHDYRKKLEKRRAAYNIAVACRRCMERRTVGRKKERIREKLFFRQSKKE